MSKRIIVTSEDKNGRNTDFYDTYEHRSMTREKFVRDIERGKYDNYHVRNINGVPTPCSNPDKSKNNNLD